MASKRVALIGTGPSGLSVLRAFSLENDSNVEIVCFEKDSDWGGMWNFTWQTGLDSFGEPVHGSMYRNLWSNGPKECLEYADYTFDEHFGRAIPSFPRREVLREYIVGRAEASRSKHLVQFSTAVRYVFFDEKTSKFTVLVENLQTGKSEVSVFDFVIVATGHFSVPFLPTFAGIESFPGRVLHSHDFKDARHFKRQDVLVVGSSYSAEDIALQLHKFGARSVTISFRTRPMGFKWPQGIEEVPLLSLISGHTVHFQNGQQRDFDTIILCTGYRHHFPFLAEDLRLVTTNRLYPPQLYKGIVFHDFPKLLYIGMQDLFFSLTLFDAQAWYARDLITERRPLPTVAARAADIAAWRAREAGLEGATEGIRFQADYVADLLAGSDYPPYDVTAVAAMLEAWEADKERTIVGYRDAAYVSVVTGSRSEPGPVPWLLADRDAEDAVLGAGRP